MDRIRIIGGTPLKGTISIGGAKNAALALMPASLLTDETLTLSNLPHLVDITTMANLLAQHGVLMALNGDTAKGGHTGRVLDLTANTITNTTAPYDLVRRMRASRCPAAAPSAPVRWTCTSRPWSRWAPRSSWRAATSRPAWTAG